MIQTVDREHLLNHHFYANSCTNPGHAPYDAGRYRHAHPRTWEPNLVSDNQVDGSKDNFPQRRQSSCIRPQAMQELIQPPSITVSRDPATDITCCWGYMGSPKGTMKHCQQNCESTYSNEGQHFVMLKPDVMSFLSYLTDNIWEFPELQQAHSIIVENPADLCGLFLTLWKSTKMPQYLVSN